MGMTMTQKILAAHAGLPSVCAGQLIEADLDLVLGNDITSPVAIHEMDKMKVDGVFDKDKIALVLDHFVPNKDIKSAQHCKCVREFACRHDITNYFDVGELADAPIGKYKLGWLIDYYERMIRKLGIRVQLNTECTSQMLRAMDPYAVFVATGSDEFIPPIDGLSGENVLSVREYIRSKPAVSGKQVVVLGAGQTGLEAARMLAQDNTVTVVDMMPDEIPANTDHRLDLFYAKDAGVQTVLGHKILRVDGAGVTVASVASGEERVLPADLVVVALGVRPVAELYNEIKDAFPHVCKLGDSVKPGFIVHATTAAYEAAASLPTKPYEVKEIYFAAEKEAVKPQLINPYA